MVETEILESWIAPFEAQAKELEVIVREAPINNLDTLKRKSGAFWESISDIGTSVGYDRTLATDFALLALYTTNDTVHSCVSYNANCVASAEFGIFQDTGTTKTKTKKKSPNRLKAGIRASIKKRNKGKFKDISDVVELNQHPLLDLLQNNDEDLDSADFRRLTCTYLKTLGKAYWHLQRNNEGDATEIPYGIRILKPWWVYPVRDMEGQVTGYFYTNVYGPTMSGTGKQRANAEKIYLAKEDVIDFRYPAPSDPYGGGDSPLRSAFIKTALASKYNEWQSWLLNNRCRIDGILSAATENADTTKIDRLDKAFKDKFRGGGNGGILTTDQAVKFQPVSYGPTDLGPLKVNEELKTAICNALHTPVALLDSDPKYSNLETSIELHARQAVDPDLCLIAKKINKYLVPLYEDDTFFAFEEVIPTDANYELEKEQAENVLWQAAITANLVSQNEVRARLGLDDVDGGDDTQADEPDEVEAPAAPTEPSLAQEPDEQAPQQPQAPDDEKGQLEAILKVNAQVCAGGLPRATAINILARGLQITQEAAKALVGYAVPPQGCQCGAVAAKGKKPKPKAPPAIPVADGKALVPVIQHHYAQLKAHFMGQITKGDVAGIITKAKTLPDKFIPVEDWSKDLAYDSKPVIELEMRKTANERADYYQRVGASEDVFEVMPQEIDKSVDKLSFNFAQSTLDTTTKKVNDALEQLREELREGLVDGDGIPQLTDRVQEIFDGLDDNQAALIAQSECQRAVSEGQRIAAKASGVVSGFKLLVSDDACDICLDLDGEETDLDGSFESDDYAGSLVPVHPNCRCTVLEVLKNEDDEHENQED